ncbi:helix-turn-helix transcriptional regulator [Amycolatopsis alba]|uniref:MarR family transcriptional regulator n=1 Tax=Amycolatopsis alba DSM 44262 TaxID=1125972 RepID=A0A229RBH1_AMYAL|nr:helix-turn-helix domain-containing protein [Amycolatopsis alba]OXM43839.1 MarR family transcriptional regulator [Amycolatopsis alba DSM 44262]
MADHTALSADENHVWRSLLRYRFASDVREVSDLSSADHSVLLHLAEADTGPMLQQDLASATYWSKSRMSNQPTRMEARGLVTRSPSTGSSTP